MYTRLFLDRTKSKYNKIIAEAILETKALMEKFPEISMYKSIYDQIVDIQDQIIIKKIIFTEAEIFDRYSLGSIAVKNFDIENDEFAQKLSDIFGGSIDYSTMSEN